MPLLCRRCSSGSADSERSESFFASIPDSGPEAYDLSGFYSIFGRMKRLLWLFILLSGLSFTTVRARSYSVEEIPNVQLADRTRFVSNPDGILSAATVMRIDSICYALRQRGAAQVAVVAVDSIDGGDTFTFAYELFSSWGVGRSEDSNGLGILLVRSLREIRFVTGRGVEGVLPDALCKRIQMNFMLPAFRENDYDRGMLQGVEAAAAVLSGSELETGRPDAIPVREESVPVGVWIFLGCCMVVPLVAVFRMLRCPRCKRWFALRSQGERVVMRAEGWRMVEQRLVCRHCGAEVVRRRRDSDGSSNHGGHGGMWIGGGGFFGGGGFGGGFGGGSGGGFGGGSFGGGGAGSKW